MDVFEYQVKIPKDRIAVVIGEKGVMKRRLESELGITLDVDSQEGDVFLLGKDSVRLFSAQDVIKAIGRGFNPEIALRLLKTEYVLELIDVTDYANTKNKAIRLKGRVIGENGKSRRAIESLTETSMSVYGKTIGIIGQAEHVMTAKKAVDMLLSGAPHSTVFRMLEGWRRRAFIRENLTP